ncbi:MAG: peroxide stress protein YaaA [Mariprofundaceae bacterium]|nr:peroxide stress protein YaaA [Mariprofundaceae bacterium]
MLMIISPAKTLDYKTPPPTTDFTMPELIGESQRLIDVLEQKDSFEIAELMKISMKLADLNRLRFHQWQTPFTAENAKQAIFAFKGDVYTGLDADTLDKNGIAFAQSHLRMLSGLYGLLRPLDLMQPYRLEMGTKLSNERGKSLYDFWGSLITEPLNRAVKEQGDNLLINLASNEYFKAVKVKELAAEIITPLFKEKRGEAYKTISFSAKKARGLMCRYIIDNQISNPEMIKDFDLDNYAYNPALSSGNSWVFSR